MIRPLRVGDAISAPSLTGIKLRVLAVGPKLIWARDNAHFCDYVVPLRSAVRCSPANGAAAA